MTPSDLDVRLVPLSVATMQALVDGDLEAASASGGLTATPYLVDHAWLWRIRLGQVATDPVSLDWIARAAVNRCDRVVGLVGFHGPPDERGMVEVAYGVDPAFRRQGYAGALLATALDWAASVPAVTVVRASISPDNAASLATLGPFGFEKVGEQWDEEDGLELLFERPVRRLLPLGTGDLVALSRGEPVVVGGVALDWPADDLRVLRYRREALEADPDSAPYLLHVLLDGSRFAGRIGCHEAPADGVLEIGYYVSPTFRGRGVATEMVGRFLAWLAPRGVTRVRAAVSPDNAASRAVLAHFGFVEVGDQWDDEDGLRAALRGGARGRDTD